jgi:hypothetical protein
MARLPGLPHGAENQREGGRIDTLDAAEIQRVDALCDARLQFTQQAADAVDRHCAGDAAAIVIAFDHDPERGAGLARCARTARPCVLIRPSIPLWRMVLEKDAR